MKEPVEILQYFLENNKENLFTIQASKCLSWMYHESFFLQDDQSQYITFDKKDSYFIIKFQKNTVELHGYKISSSLNSTRYMKRWMIEGSNDEENWDLLDERNDNSLNSSESILSFYIYPQGSYKYFKLTQIGKNNKNDNMLAIRYFDLIGIIK